MKQETIDSIEKNLAPDGLTGFIYHAICGKKLDPMHIPVTEVTTLPDGSAALVMKSTYTVQDRREQFVSIYEGCKELADTIKKDLKEPAKPVPNTICRVFDTPLMQVVLIKESQLFEQDDEDNYKVVQIAEYDGIRVSAAGCFNDREKRDAAFIAYTQDMANAYAHTVYENIMNMDAEDEPDVEINKANSYNPKDDM